ncbi:MAG TPA: hypothetical protein VFK85_10500 [Anaeromyxobacteraceae bacterium]|nr:hypothetical protein [Anaeromyxobacteraceae bacterium]
MMGEILKTPAVKRALEMGEERMGRLVTQLLSNEKVMHGVQTVVSSALQAKSTFDRGVKTAMQAVNLPSSDDVEELRRKLSELESTVDGLRAKVAQTGEKKGGNGA